MSKPTILVTGAAGFIGSSLCDYLVETEGFYVHGLDVWDQLREEKNWTLHQCSILDHYVLAKLLADVDPDVVVHLAALPGVRASVIDPTSTCRVNVKGTAILLDCLEHHSRASLLFASSSSVYGSATRDGPCTEAQDPSPESPYAFSKLAGEMLIESQKERIEGLKAITARLFTVYGPRGRPDMAIMKWLREIQGGITPQLYGNGTFRDWTYISDVCYALTEMVIHLSEGLDIEGPVNVSSGNPIDVLGAYTQVLHAGGFKGTGSTVERQAGDVVGTWGSSEKLRDFLKGRGAGDWEPTGFAEGLRRTVDWLQS